MKKRDIIPGLEALEDAICDGGTIRAQCGFCGRTHFNYVDRHYYDPASELHALEDAARKEPDKYVPSDRSREARRGGRGGAHRGAAQRT